MKKKRKWKSSIRKAISSVEGEITLIQDADLEYHPSDYIEVTKTY